MSPVRRHDNATLRYVEFVRKIYFTCSQVYFSSGSPLNWLIINFVLLMEFEFDADVLSSFSKLLLCNRRKCFAHQHLWKQLFNGFTFSGFFLLELCYYFNMFRIFITFSFRSSSRHVCTLTCLCVERVPIWDLKNREERSRLRTKTHD